MENTGRRAQSLDRLNAAVTFLDTVRRRCPNAEVLQVFDNCLVEYQAALIALLISEELRGAPVAGSKQGDHGSRENRNGTSHAQLVIKRAHNYEQHLQALATYLEVRQRLNKTLMHLQDVPHDQPHDSGGYPT